jgi:hypothetical protein
MIVLYCDAGLSGGDALLFIKIRKLRREWGEIMRRFVTGMLLVGFVIGAGQYLLAGPVLGPSYKVWWDRNEEGATWQEWHFDDDDNPAPPEQFDNPFGVNLCPEADISLGDEAHNFPPGWSELWNGREGVWHSDVTEITLTIPNDPTERERKEVWVEVGFRGNLLPDERYPDYPQETYGPKITSSSDAYEVKELDTIVDLFLDGWKRLIIGWEITPNVTDETIYLAFHNSGADIDYVIVDTICVPEPATIFLLTTGAFFSLYKRKF